jgi:hypothetical protein
MTKPLTVAERTHYRETSRHADVLRFIDELKGTRPRFTVESMGISGKGQEMPVLVFGQRSDARPVVLVVANIHAGEVEGKEACLMLARDLPDAVFDKLTVLLVPNYNPDGNDLVDPANRKLDLEKLEGQIGPEGGVGTRYTADGINLNRDYMKMEAVESRNLSKLYGKWQPTLTVDCHTTDGSIHGFALTYDTGHIPNAPCAYVESTMLPEVTRRLDKRTGIRTFFYGNFVDEKDLSKGWATYSHLPRYGSHYRGLTGRMDILLETYSYIPFRDRVVTTVEILKEILDYAVENGTDMMRRVAEAQAARPDPVGIAYGPPRRTGECDILAWDTESQMARRIPGAEARTYRIPHLRTFEPSKTVPRPAGYLIPRTHWGVAERLRDHNLVVERTALPASLEVEAYRITHIEITDSPDVGTAKHVECSIAARMETVQARIEPGDFVVRTDQPLGTLAVYLLEPESDDGLTRWNFFDAAIREWDLHPVSRIVSAANLPPLRPY